MSLILEGIDMPKTEYEEVIIRIKHTGEVCDAQNIHLYAQAIQIPKGHGRLIDGDELISDLRIYESKYCGEQGYITQDDIIDAPTIIDAEE